MSSLLRVAGAALVFGSTILAPAAWAVPRAGDQAPELALERLLQAPDGTALDWASLRGQVVVLEFWATWCGPCLTGMPAFNEKVRLFQDKPVRFLSITDEPAEVVEAFLGQRALEGWVGVDADRSIFQAYGVGGIPTTVIVDGEGKVALRTSPHQLSPPLLDALIDGRKVTLETPEARQVPPAPSEVKEAGVVADNPLFNVSIVPVDIREHVTQRGGKPYRDVKPTHLVARGVSLRNLIELAWDVPRSAIETGIAWGPQIFDVTAYTAGAPYAWREALAGALIATFDLDVRRVTQPREVLILTAPGDPGPGLEAGSGPEAMNTGGGRLGMRNKDIDTLAHLMSISLRQRVFNETGLGGSWSCELNWNRKQPESIRDATAEHLGLKLEPAMRDLDLLLVERRISNF